MYYLTVLRGRYRLLDQKSLKTSLESILRVLFMITDTHNTATSIEDSFMQLHFAKDEISIIIPEKYLDYFKDECQYTSSYVSLRMDTDDPGLEESGILAVITNTFKQYEIPILSVSTYRYNYIYIPSDKRDVLDMIASENENIRLIIDE